MNKYLMSSSVSRKITIGVNVFDHIYHLMFEIKSICQAWDL